MRLHLIFSISSITLALAIPSIIPQSTADDVVLRQALEENLVSLTFDDDPKKDNLDDQTETIAMPKNLDCLSKDNVLQYSWVLCGYHHDKDYICRSWLETCTVGHLGSGEEDKTQVCDSDDCTENWFGGSQPHF